MSFMTALAEKLGLITPVTPLTGPSKDEVRELQSKVKDQIHERDLATARISAATDAQVREADIAIRAVRGVLENIEKRPRGRLRSHR